MEEDKILETVLSKLDYTVLKDVLVKPLEPVMVTKEFIEQVPTGETDEEGYNKYETKTEKKEVESNWAIGVVLQIPDGMEVPFKPGTKVVYNKKFAVDFDLFKDSKLVKPYDVVATCK